MSCEYDVCIPCEQVECDETGRLERVLVDGVWYVPERTCRDKAKSGPYFWCDSCNQFVIYPSPPNYCPECGAKVVDE